MNMDPEQPNLIISDVVLSTTGRDKGKIFFVIGIEDDMLLLVNGKEMERESEIRCRKKRLHL